MIEMDPIEINVKRQRPIPRKQRQSVGSAMPLNVLRRDEYEAAMARERANQLRWDKKYGKDKPPSKLSTGSLADYLKQVERTVDVIQDTTPKLRKVLPRSRRGRIFKKWKASRTRTIINTNPIIITGRTPKRKVRHERARRRNVNKIARKRKRYRNRLIKSAKRTDYLIVASAVGALVLVLVGVFVFKSK